jgi:hypothetical protein
MAPCNLYRLGDGRVRALILAWLSDFASHDEVRTFKFFQHNRHLRIVQISPVRFLHRLAELLHIQPLDFHHPCAFQHHVTVGLDVGCIQGRRRSRSPLRRWHVAGRADGGFHRARFSRGHPLLRIFRPLLLPAPAPVRPVREVSLFPPRSVFSCAKTAEQQGKTMSATVMNRTNMKMPLMAP